MIAPAAPGIECPDNESSLKDGCKLLVFTYEPATKWGAPEKRRQAPGKNHLLRLWLRRSLGCQPHLQRTRPIGDRTRPAPAHAQQESYSYNASGQIASLTPGALKPWTMQYTELYKDAGPGRLSSVTRATLVESNPNATTTVAYNVPLSGGSGRVSMEGAAVQAWGQHDLHTDATAIFRPTNPPRARPRATRGRRPTTWMRRSGFERLDARRRRHHRTVDHDHRDRQVRKRGPRTDGQTACAPSPKALENQPRNQKKSTPSIATPKTGPSFRKKKARCIRCAWNPRVPSSPLVCSARSSTTKLLPTSTGPPRRPRRNEAAPAHHGNDRGQEDGRLGGRQTIHRICL